MHIPESQGRLRPSQRALVKGYIPQVHCEIVKFTGMRRVKVGAIGENGIPNACAYENGKCSTVNGVFNSVMNGGNG